jgi:polar amino acid transport system substrate-binding protein
MLKFNFTRNTTNLFWPVLLMLLSWSCWSNAEKVSIAAGEYPPWLSKSLPNYGFIAQVITESFKASGYQTTFTFLPWKRAYAEAKKGKYVATAYWYPSKDRELSFIYSAPLTNESTHFFYRKDNPLKQWNTLSDLKGYKIGATDGFTYTEEFWNAEKDGSLVIETAIRDELNMAKLIKGRIDLFPVEKHLGINILLTHFKPHSAYLIDFHPKPLFSTTGHLLFSRAHPDALKRVTAFNSGLKKLRKSGRYEELLDINIIGLP